jgi:hypothetical protein
VEFLKSVNINRVQVGEQHQGNLRHRPDAPDQFQHAMHVSPGFQSPSGGHLIHDAIGQRIGKGQAEFDHVHATGFERFHVLQGFVQRGIARTDICHKCLAARLPQRGESSVQTGSHN